MVKNLHANAGDPGSIPGWGRSPGEGNGNPLQYPCLENPHGQRNLVSYRPCDRRETSTTIKTDLYPLWGARYILFLDLDAG